jgi:hypothetical protein
MQRDNKRGSPIIMIMLSGMSKNIIGYSNTFVKNPAKWEEDKFNCEDNSKRKFNW